MVGDSGTNARNEHTIETNILQLSDYLPVR